MVLNGVPLEWFTFYLDDGLLVGSIEHVFQAFSIVQTLASARGVQLNPTKCKLWGPGAPLGSDNVPCLPGFIPPDHPFRQVSVVAFSAQTGLEVLGVPVNYPGAHAKVRQKWLHVVVDLERSCHALSEFPNAQVQLLLLRACLDACKVNHLLRSSNSFVAQEFVDRANSVIRATLEDIIGVGLSELQWMQATVPMRLGGLGVKSPALKRAAA